MGAPQASASADIKVFMNVVNTSAADPATQTQLLVQDRVGSILEGAVIAWLSCRTVVNLQEDHVVAALLVYATPSSGLPYTSPLDATSG
jgi:hypothetical protein